MAHESPEFTISRRIGDVLRRPLASFMGVVALLASGCGSPSLDAKPAPATVTVTATERPSQTPETPQPTQTVRVTETVTQSPPPSKDTKTIIGQIICDNDMSVVGAWAESANEASMPSRTIEATPTHNRSVADFKMAVVGNKVKVAVGCGGEPGNWTTTSYTSYTDFSSAGKEGKVIITCSPNGNNGWCEVKEK